MRDAASCPKSKRPDGKHSFEFDGDNPRIVCAYCGETRDALSGATIKQPSAAWVAR